MFRAAPTLTLIVFGALVVAAAAGGVITAQSAAPGLTFGHRLAHYDAEQPEIRTLPDGGRIAVGSRSGHDITVQWGEPQRDSWSAPRQIQREPKFWTHDITVRHSHGTVAIAPDFWVERVLDDDYAPKFTTLTVCRDYRCDGSRRSRRLSGTDFAEDGDLVTFGLDRKTILLWERGRGYRTTTIRGIPSGDRNVRVMPDGSFYGVAGRWDGQQCHYVLYTAGHRSTSFHRRLETPGFYDLKPCYLSGTQTAGNDAVNVWVESLSDEITFRRNGSTWKLDSTALERMQIKDTEGRSTIAPFEINAGGARLLFGSRDRIRILIQSRRGDKTPWSKERTVAHAPKGTVCRNASGDRDYGKGRTAMVLIHCYADSRKVSRTDAPSDVAIVLATPDGKRWSKRTLQHPRWDVLTSRSSLVAVGRGHSLLFRNGVLTELKLPMNSEWDGLGLSQDGSHLARIVGNGNPAAQCRPAWTYVSVRAKAWPAPTPFAADGYPRAGTCSGSIYADGPDTFTAGAYQTEWSWEGGLRLRHGRLEVMPPPE
jgi:hypothetical protein